MRTESERKYAVSERICREIRAEFEKKQVESDRKQHELRVDSERKIHELRTLFEKKYIETDRKHAEFEKKYAEFEQTQAIKYNDLSHTRDVLQYNTLKLFHVMERGTEL